MAHDVFISYASGDKAVADAVCATLESRGIRCWIAPRDVLPGLHYGEAIIDAIRECHIMVLVFSSKANLSGHIPKEIERAVSQGSTIMPLRIENVVPAKSLDYFIGSVHWLDALSPPLEAHLQKLVADVQTLLARKASATAVAPPSVVEVQARPAPPPVPPPSPGARPSWTRAIIGVLVAAVVVLGFFMVRFILQSRSAAPAQAAAPRMQSIPQPAADSPAPAPVGTAQAPPAPVAATNASPPADQPATVAQPGPAKSASATNPSRKLVFRKAPGATIKLEQLVGDQDKQTRQPTRNQTATRFGLEGAELGYSFDDGEYAYFLFSDAIGPGPQRNAGRRGFDTFARTTAGDPEAGVPLNFPAVGQRPLMPMEPTGIETGIGSGPVAGISLNGQIYVVFRANEPAPRRTVLTKFTRPASFQPLRTVSQMPAGRFMQMTLHQQPGPVAGLPEGGPFVMMWGTNGVAQRASFPYLAVVPVAQFESGNGIRYFAGLGPSGAPAWSEDEGDAQPVMQQGTLNVSVIWCKELGLWLMTYDRPGGIFFSYSGTPWGPWSEAQQLLDSAQDGFGKFIHDPQANPNDGLAGPVLLPRNQDKPDSVRGAAYAPYIVGRWTKVRGSELDLYYTLSTLNPYVVVLMKSRLQIE